MQRLGVLRRRAATGPHRRPQDQRHFQFAAGHVMDFGRLIGHLVHGQGGEIAKHDVNYRTHTSHGGADAQAGDARLGNGRVDDALWAKLVYQSNQHLKRRAGLGDVFAQHEDAGITPHFLGQGFFDRLAVG